MFSKLAVVSLAAISAVNASPLLAKRQTTASMITAAQATTTGVISGLVTPSSAATTVTTTRATGTSATASSTVATTSATVSASATSTANTTYSLYPCPSGYLLTYVQQNVTLPARLADVRTAFGNWSNSPFFPNVTNSTGGNTNGAMHTLSIQGVTLREVLVNYTRNATTGYERFIWNLTNGPVSFSGVSVSNYSTVLQLSDPAINRNGTTGSTTFVNLFTNFCASSQALGQGLVSSLAQLELGTFSAVVARAAGTSTAVSSSSRASTPSMMSTMSSAMSGASVVTRLTSTMAPLSSVTSMVSSAMAGAPVVRTTTA